MGVIQIQVFKQLSILNGVSSAQQMPHLPGYMIILGFLPVREILGVETVRGTESMSTVRTTTREMKKSFKPGLW